MEVVFYLAYRSQMGNMRYKGALLAPWVVTIMANRWSHKGCGDVVLLYLGEVLQSTTWCFRAAKLCYTRCHEETRTSKTPPDSWVAMSQQRVESVCDSLSFFLFFFLNLHNKQFVFIVLSIFLHAVNSLD